jgi:N-acetylglucosaminyldiphosphoundecaprenol N-acetyl-beta-D-mannosaminyltransferase
VELMGVGIDVVDEGQVVAAVLAGLERGHGGWICPVNLDVLRQVVHSTELHELVAGADLAIADGMPLLWAGKLQGTPLPERVTGAALSRTLSAAAAARGRSVFLVGGRSEEVTAAAVERLCEELPELRVAGSCCPRFGFERSPEQSRAVIEQVRAAQPDLVLVGLGFPKQDRLIAELRRLLPASWFLSCGAGIDFLAGEVQRAPTVMQRSGLEWVHRLVQQPRRLAKRYLVQGVPFAARVLLTSLLRRPLAVLRLGSGPGRAQEPRSPSR